MLGGLEIQLDGRDRALRGGALFDAGRNGRIGVGDRLAN